MTKAWNLIGFGYVNHDDAMHHNPTPLLMIRMHSHKLISDKGWQLSDYGYSNNDYGLGFCALHTTYSIWVLSV
jgi:hypothetical protein